MKLRSCSKVRCTISEYAVIQLQLNDQDSIVKALEEMGYKCEVHDTPQTLVGYMGDNRTQKAHIIVGRKNISSASNDIGFVKTANGNYEMIISDYDRHTSHSKNFLEKLNQIYSKQRVIKQARQMGYTVSSQSIEQDGRLRLRLMTR